MNNKGFMKFEVLTVLVLLIIVFSGAGYLVLKSANKQKFKTMGSNGIRLSEIIVTNISSFKNLNTVYLGEAINEELIKNIKNPFGKGNCDETQSKVDIIDGEAYTTLKCGNYLIDKTQIVDIKDLDIYKISEWQSEKITGDNVEEKTFYNCEKDGKNLYDEYFEDNYLVAKINYDFNTSYYFKEDLTAVCDKLNEKVFYRTKEVIK